VTGLVASSVLVAPMILAACGRSRASPTPAAADAAAEQQAATGSPSLEIGPPPPPPGGWLLDGGEDDRDLGKFCKSSVSYPILSRLESRSAERALNIALAAAARGGASRCRGSSEAHPYEFTTTYGVADASHPGVVELYFEWYENFGGAHGYTSGRCYVADLDRGTLTPVTLGLLKAAARITLGRLTREALAGSRDTLFDLDHLAPDEDTTLCAERGTLRVTFSAGLASRWMGGPVSATLASADARPLVVGTPLEVFFP